MTIRYNSDERDDKLSELIALTGTDAGLARDLLEGSDWNVGLALRAFTTLTVSPRYQSPSPTLASRVRDLPPLPLSDRSSDFFRPPEIHESPDYAYHHPNRTPINFRAHNILDHLPRGPPPPVPPNFGNGGENDQSLLPRYGRGFKTFDLTHVNLDSSPLGTTGPRPFPTSRSRDQFTNSHGLLSDATTVPDDRHVSRSHDVVPGRGGSGGPGMSRDRDRPNFYKTSPDNAIDREGNSRRMLTAPTTNSRSRVQDGGVNYHRLPSAGAAECPTDSLPYRRPTNGIYEYHGIETKIDELQNILRNANPFPPTADPKELEPAVEGLSEPIPLPPPNFNHPMPPPIPKPPEVSVNGIPAGTASHASQYFPFYLPNVWTEFFIQPTVGPEERSKFLKFFNGTILDKSVSKILESSGKLNWWIREPERSSYSRSKLWALSASGDGNCLLHAASLGIWGFNDKSLTLRNALYEALINDKPDGTLRAQGGPLWRRWRLRQTIMNQQCGLEFNDQEWEDEWAGVVNRAAPFATNDTTSAAIDKRSVPKDIHDSDNTTKMTLSYGPGKSHTTTFQEMVPSQTGSTDAPTIQRGPGPSLPLSHSCELIEVLDRRKSSLMTNNQPLPTAQAQSPTFLPIYQSLEEFHIYVLANVLRRPVLVLSQSVLKDVDGQPLSPITFGGVYLPLEHEPRDCRKSPLILAYEASHFSPLVLMGAPCAELADNGSSQVLGDVKLIDPSPPLRPPLPDEAVYATEDGQKLSFYNVNIPLVDSNLRPLPIHFAIDPGPSTPWTEVALLARQSSPLLHADYYYTNGPSSSSSGYLSDPCVSAASSKRETGTFPPKLSSNSRRPGRSIWHRTINQQSEPAQSDITPYVLSPDLSHALLEKYLDICYLTFETDEALSCIRGSRLSASSKRRSASCQRGGGPEAAEVGVDNDWRASTEESNATSNGNNGSSGGWGLKWSLPTGRKHSRSKGGAGGGEQSLALIKPMATIRIYYECREGRYIDRVDRFARKMVERYRSASVPSRSTTTHSSKSKWEPSDNNATPAPPPENSNTVRASTRDLGVGYELSSDFLRPPHRSPQRNRVPQAGTIRDNNPPTTSHGPDTDKSYTLVPGHTSHDTSVGSGYNTEQLNPSIRERASTFSKNQSHSMSSPTPLRAGGRNTRDFLKVFRPPAVNGHGSADLQVPEPSLANVAQDNNRSANESRKHRSRSHHRYHLMVDKLAYKSAGAINDIMNTVGRGLLPQHKGPTAQLANRNDDHHRQSNVGFSGGRKRSGTAKFYEPAPPAYATFVSGSSDKYPADANKGNISKYLAGTCYGGLNTNNNNSCIGTVSERHASYSSYDHLNGTDLGSYSSTPDPGYWATSSQSSSSHCGSDVSRSEEHNGHIKNKDRSAGAIVAATTACLINGHGLSRWLKAAASSRCNPRGNIFNGFRRPNQRYEPSVITGEPGFGDSSCEKSQHPEGICDTDGATKRYRLLQIKKLPSSPILGISQSGESLELTPHDIVKGLAQHQVSPTFAEAPIQNGCLLAQTPYRTTDHVVPYTNHHGLGDRMARIFGP